MGQVDGSESSDVAAADPLPPYLAEYMIHTELVTTYIMPTPTLV
jgi:hypothetical protein